MNIPAILEVVQRLMIEKEAEFQDLTYPQLKELSDKVALASIRMSAACKALEDAKTQAFRDSAANTVLLTEEERE